jgi:hypothetical protein
MGAADLIAAYHATDYQVLDPEGGLLGTVRIGQVSREIDRLLALYGARSGVFITGWNPRSAPTARDLNEAAHRRLQSELRVRGIRFLPHHGVGAAPAWSEEGVFALDLPNAEALELASLFQQNAIVAVRVGEPAQLLLTSLLVA